jgi:hypothetical protein
MFAAQLTRKQLSTVGCLVLTAVTLLVYLPMLWHGFVNYDDPDYITNNPHVQAGLTWPGIVWAFQSGEASNWHPLTWISHMADWQLFGRNAAGHHLVNLLFHTANTLLLFLLLNRLTGALWRSAFVAALFAWHPLHVESVAWASERKDVLSAFFWMLTMLAYVRFANLSKVHPPSPGSGAARSPKSKVFYVLALILFACGLMSKPMVVTLPFVLLLLDFWPLQRFNRLTIQRLFVEKLPFFALTAASCIITFMVQRGALWSAASLPFSFRLENAVMSYVRYLSKMFWPTDLALIYPYPHHWPLAAVIVVVFLLAMWSALFLWWAKRFPYLAVGWFWYLGTLVPAIGLVQAGVQSMADRYTYLPGIGLFIIVAWGLNDLLNSHLQKPKIAAAAGGLALAGCLAVASIQLNYWRNSVSIFLHTVQATTDNYAADDCLGKALEDTGKNNDAENFYAQCVEIEPDYPMGQFDLGMMQLQQGRPDEASNHLAIAAQLAPQNPVMQFDFGTFLLQHGKPDAAADYFKAALAARPEFPEARRSLDEALGKIKTAPPTNAIRSTP